jgi:hypothetical protein
VQQSQLGRPRRYLHEAESGAEAGEAAVGGRGRHRPDGTLTAWRSCRRSGHVVDTRTAGSAKSTPTSRGCITSTKPLRAGSRCPASIPHVGCPGPTSPSRRVADPRRCDRRAPAGRWGIPESGGDAMLLGELRTSSPATASTVSSPPLPPPVADGYMLSVDCPCGVEFMRRVTPGEAARDLVLRIYWRRGADARTPLLDAADRCLVSRSSARRASSTSDESLRAGR